MRILAVTSYNGTNYQGWQKQPNGNTIQDEIEKVLSQYFNRPISIYGAGRTDAGVHAEGQRFHFDVDTKDVDLDRLLYSINSMLPKDIKIEDFEQVEDDFHSRFDAKEKVYVYTIYLGSKDVFFYPIMWMVPDKLDIELLKKCLTHFKGKHNFRNFTSKEEDEDGFVRTIYEIRVDQTTEKVINIVFRGNGFMRYTIRFIVGVAVECAKGNIKEEEVIDLLSLDGERRIVSSKAPANGLLLADVIY